MIDSINGALPASSPVQSNLEANSEFGRLGGRADLSSGAESFSSVLASLAKDSIATVQAGEQAAKEAMLGRVPVQQAVQAVMEAERTLHSAIAIRDKVVSAYLEISRMPI